VGEDGFFAEQVEHDRVVDELRAARLREGGSEKEVAVAVHHEDARAAAGAFCKAATTFALKGSPMSSSPAQYSNRSRGYRDPGPGRRARGETGKRPD